MLKKRRALLLAAVILAAAMLFSCVGFGFAVADDGGSGSGDSGGSGGGGGSSTDGLLTRLINAVLELPEKIVKTLVNFVFDLYGTMIDAFLKSFCAILPTAFTRTPYPGSIAFVNKGNVTVCILCVCVSVLLLVISVVHILHGKKQPIPVLKSFIAAVVLSVFSVQIVNVLVFLANTAASGLAQAALSGYTPDQQLDVNTLSATQIISIPFQNPATFGTQIPFHTLFDPLRPDTGGGGLIPLVLAAAGWTLLSAFALARNVIICVATILAPVYLTMTVLSHRLEPAVGWLTLISRTVFLSVFWVLGWQMMVYIRAAGDTSLFGASVAATNIVFLYVIIYLSWRYWAKPTAAQISAPVTLAGGTVMTAVGQAGEKIGSALRLLGMVTAQPEIIAAGEGIRQKGAQAAARGREMTQGRSVLDGFDLSKSPSETKLGVGKIISGMIEKRYHARTDESVDRRYWSYKGKYVIVQNGLPVIMPAPPVGYEYAGEWRE